MGRNRVRHELLPALGHGFNPRIVEALNRLATLQRLDNTFLEHAVDQAHVACVPRAGCIDGAAFRGLDPALQYRLVARLLQQAGAQGDFDTVERGVDFLVNLRPGKQLDLGNGFALYGGSGHGVIGPLIPRVVEAVPLPVPGSALAGGYRITARLLTEPPASSLADYCNPSRQVVDGRALGTTVAVRTRRPGDRFQPLGMAGTRKLKDYFQGLGLSRTERDHQLLVVSGDTILWVVGHTIAGCAAVTGSTHSWVELTVKPQEEPADVGPESGGPCSSP
jgi:tRNA(Ile)-lysidine synthase